MQSRVILIRPEGQNDSIAARLRQQSIEPLICPVLEITPTLIDDVQRQRVMNLDAYDHIIFVSRNAVTFGVPQIDRYWPQLPTHVKWYAIGQATGAALHAEGIEAMMPAESSSEGLLAMKSLQQPGGSRVLIFRGVGGRPTLSDGLASRGAQVDLVEVYERRAVPAAPASIETVRSIEAGVLLVYSGESLQAFCDAFVPDPARFALVVASARLQAIAMALGFATIFTASGPDDDAMFDATRRACAHQS